MVKPDGLTIVNFIGNLISQQFFGGIALLSLRARSFRL